MLLSSPGGFISGQGSSRDRHCQSGIVNPYRFFCHRLHSSSMAQELGGFLYKLRLLPLGVPPKVIRYTKKTHRVLWTLSLT